MPIEEVQRINLNKFQQNIAAGMALDARKKKMMVENAFLLCVCILIKARLEPQYYFAEYFQVW